MPTVAFLNNAVMWGDGECLSSGAMGDGLMAMSIDSEEVGSTVSKAEERQAVSLSKPVDCKISNK